MKKYFFLFVLVFLSFNLFSLDYKNFLSVGFTAYGNSDENAVRFIDSYAPAISYERLIFQDSDILGFSAEANLFVAPYNNDYSFSLNAICYFGEFEGLFVGVSPFSNINFGNLFLESPYLNYGIGTFLGYKKNLNKTSFESKVAFSFPVYDKVKCAI